MLITASSTRIAHYLVILGAAALLALPCLVVGIPHGYDAVTHTAYQYHFSRQFWEGDLYPRWLTGANKGYGSPIFLIQYPVPYFLAALLRPITSFAPNAAREPRELGIVCFLALAAAGLTARIWFRRYCVPVVATTAAIVYMALPYILGQSLYACPRLGELWTFAWMPLALAISDKDQPRFVSVAALGVVIALLFLSHVMTTALFLPVLAGYAILSRPPDVSLAKCVRSLFFAVALATGLAAVYLIPLIAYQHLIDVPGMQTSMPGFELGRHFVYLTWASLSKWSLLQIAGAIYLTLIVALYVWRSPGKLATHAGMVFTLLLGMAVMIPEFGPKLIRSSGLKVSDFLTIDDYSGKMLFTGFFTVALAIIAYWRISRTAVPRDGWLLGVACVSFVLMLPWAAPVWRAVPQLAALQFPFRFTGNVTVATAGLVAAAIDRSWSARAKREERSSLVLLAMLVLAVAATSCLNWGLISAWWAPRTTTEAMHQNVDLMFRSYVAKERLAAFAQRLGTPVGSFEIPMTPVADGIAAEFTKGRGTVDVRSAGPRRLHVSANCSEDARVRLGQLYFPLWRVVPAVSGNSPILESSSNGLMEMSLGAGRHDFDLLFDTGWPEQAGVLATVVSLLFVLGGCAFVALRGRKGRPA